MLDSDDKVGYLLHNTQDRYQDDWFLPLKTGTFVFSEHAYNLPAGCLSSQNVQLFQGAHVEQAQQHALNWLRKKRGVRCPQAGGILSEYNLKEYVNQNESVSKKMLTVLKDIYEPLFLQ